MERSKSIISILVGVGAVLIVWRVGFYPPIPEQPEKSADVAVAEPNTPDEIKKPDEPNEPMVTFGDRFRRDRRGRGSLSDANEPGRLTAAGEPNESVDPNNPMEFVNLKSVEMKTIVEKLAQWTGKVIIPTDEAMKLKVTVYAPEKLPRSKAISVIYSALRLKGYTASETDGEIFLEPITDAKLGRVPTIGANEPLALIENKEQIVQKFFELASYSPTEMGTIVQPLIGEHGHVSVDETTGTLMVIDTVSNLIRLERIITQFDVPGAEQAVTDIIEVRYGDPSEIVQMLDILLGNTQGVSTMRSNRYRDQRGGFRGPSRPSPPVSRASSSSSSSKKPSAGKTEKGTASSVVVGATGGPVILIPEPRRKWIIAKASAEDLNRIRDWVTKLDKEEPVESEFEVVQLRYADPREVEDSIGEGFSDLPGTQFLPSILLQPLEETRQVIVFGRKDLREIVKKMIAEVDVPPGQFETAHIKLKHADPDTIKEKLDELYEQGMTSSSNRYGFYGYNRYSRGRGSSSQSSEMVKIISYSTLNEITVVASPENMVEIRKRIAEWDVPLDVESLKPRIIELHNMDPVEMADLLTSLFSESSGVGGRGRSMFDMLFGRGGADQEKIVGPLYGQLTFEEVPGTKKIIVVSKIAEAYGVIENLVTELDREEMGEIPHVIELKYADPEDLSERLNALFVEPGQQARIRKTAQGLSDTSEMDESDGSSGNSGSNQANQDEYTPPWSGAGARSSMGADSEMPISNVIGRVRFVPEPHTKSIMVLAPPEFMDEIEALIDALDVPGKQVVIEAIIVEVEHSKVTSLGVELSTNPNAFGTLGENAILALSNLTHFGTAGTASGQISPIAGEFNTSGTSGTTLGIGTDVYGLIDFLIKTTSAKILNQQTLWTKDNEEANFFKGSQVAFLSGTTQTANIGTTQDITFEKVGMELRARPSITPEDNVDMIVNVQISQLTEDREQGQPIRSKMNTTTNMIVKSGQTLLLGGILFQKDSKVEHKLPLLGDAPLIGGLFRHNAVTQSNSEMLVFMTPRVIEEPNASVPEAINPQEKLNEIREQLGTSLQGLNSKSKKDDKSDDMAKQAQNQTDEPTAQLHNKDQAEKSQASPDPSVIADSAKDDNATRQVDNPKNPNVHSFDAIRPQINPGQSSMLSWSISNAERVRIEPGVGVVGTLGSTVVTPSKTTTYTLIATNDAGESRQTQQIEVLDQGQDKSMRNLRTTASLDDRKRRGR